MIQHALFSELCRSVGHPVRIAILNAIVEQDNCVQRQTLEIPDVSQAAFAIHIRAMKRAGLIKGKLIKSNYCYCVDWDKLETLKLLFDELYSKVAAQKQQIESKKGACIKES